MRNMNQEIKVLITGSSGFIGSALMTYLLRKGFSVMGIDINDPPYTGHRKFWKKVDILDKTSLHNAMIRFGPSHLVHLAARTDLGLDDDVEGFRANTEGVRNVLDICRILPELQMAIFASTILVCEPGYIPKADDDYYPTTPYGKSKVIGERIVRDADNDLNFTWSIIRPTSIWGPGYGSHYLDFFRTIARGWYFHPGKANNLTVYGYIGNAVYQIEKLMVANPDKVHGKVFYIGDYWPTRLKEWAALIHSELGKRKVKVLPDGLVRLVALCGDLLWHFGWKSVPLTTFRLGNMSRDRLYDTSAIQSIADDLPYSQMDGVRETILWLKENG